MISRGVGRTGRGRSRVRRIQVSRASLVASPINLRRVNDFNLHDKDVDSDFDHNSHERPQKTSFEPRNVANISSKRNETDEAVYVPV